MFEYRVATREDLENIWNLNIARHPGDERWVHWKGELIGYNVDGRAVTFVTVLDGKPVGEGTWLISPTCSALAGLEGLADDKTTVNLNGLRILKDYEGQGHTSKLVKFMESWAKDNGYTRVTIGVDASEARNLGIYLHWGYTTYLCHEIENGELVLYYGKNL